MMDHAILSQIRHLFSSLADDDRFSGVVLLRRGVEVLLAEPFGDAVRAWGVKNTMTTRFRVASIGKMFTAAAILQLVEAGTLSLDSSVVTLLGLTGTKIPEQVTIAQLLSHTSGVADYFDEDSADEEAWERLWQERPIYAMRTLADYYPMFAFSEPQARPGERFHYSGAGYILLGMVIEALSGKTYFDYISENIFARLGMHGSEFIATDDVEPGVAEGYMPVLSRDGSRGWRRNIFSVTPMAASDGGLVSTADDLISFSQSLRSGKVVSPALAALMVKPHALVSEAPGPDGLSISYGFANFLVCDSGGEVVRTGHSGEEAGVSCRLFHFPKAELDLAILGNQSECAGRPGKAVSDLLIAIRGAESR